MRRLFSLLTLAVIVFGVTSSSWAQPVTGSEGRAGAPEGRLTFAVAITLAPTFFDPAETPGVITPFLMLYAIHDAMVKPMPGNPWAPGLAESWTMSKDGLTYEFVLRKGVST